MKPTIIRIITKINFIVCLRSAVEKKTARIAKKAKSDKKADN